MKRLLGVLIVACGLMAPSAQAGMIGTDEAVPAPPQRERLKTFLARAQEGQQLEKLGVDAIAAPARVGALGGSEVTQLAGVVDALPAGGVLSNQDLLLIIIVVLLVLLLI